MNALLWTARLVVVLPALAAVIGLLVPRGSRRLAAAIAVGTAGATLVVAVVELLATHDGRSRSGISLLGTAQSGAGAFSLDLRGDRLSALVAVAVALVALCVQAYSTAYLADDRRYPAYAAEVSLFSAAMMLVVQADNLFLLLIGWEVMGLCSYLLVGHDSERLAARRAAVKAFLVTRVGDLGFVLGVIVLVAGTHTSSITRLLDPATRAGVDGWVWPLGLLLLLAGVVGKSAQFPLHTWLPDAMEGPTPVSALIHAATMVAAGAYLVARLLPVMAYSAAARDVLAVIACVTMLGAALAAFGQADLKRLLAYSTISQVAYMLAALSVSPARGAGAGPGIAHLLAHAEFKALLFLAAGAFAFLAGTTLLSGLAGAWQRAPLLAGCFTVGLAGLAGVPPLSGFWSKEAVLGAAEHAARHGDVRVAGWLVLLVGVVTSAVTAAYATRAFLLVVPAHPVIEAASAAELAEDTATDVEMEGPRPSVADAMRWPVVVLAVATVVGGLAQVGSLIPGQLPVSVLTLVVTLLLEAGAVVVVVRWAQRSPERDPLAVVPRRLQTLLLNGFGIDALQHRLVVRPVRRLAEVVVGGDRDVVDAYARGSATVTRWGGVLLRRAQTGVATSYLTWLAAGVVVAGIAGVSLR
ncbi:MAG: NADH-quinone oxidoreductase subunit L [Actinomycetales bacterium]